MLARARACVCVCVCVVFESWTAKVWRAIRNRHETRRGWWTQKINSQGDGCGILVDVVL